MTAVAEDSKFSCRMCRTVLFTGADVVGHEAEADGQERRFSGKKWDDKNTAVAGAALHPCTSYFLAEAPSWLGAAAAGAFEGKIVCPNPKCGARVGSFCWGGAQCSCGFWVVPCVQFPRSKVDERLSVTAAAAAAASVEAAARAEAEAAAAAAEAAARRQRAPGSSQQSIADMLSALAVAAEPAAAAPLPAPHGADAGGSTPAAETPACVTVSGEAAATEEAEPLAPLSQLLNSGGSLEHFPSELAVGYGNAFDTAADASLEALLAPDIVLTTPRGTSVGAAAALKALLTSRARMAVTALRVGAPTVVSPYSAEVTFSFASKTGAQVTMADVLTVQRKVIVSIVRRKVQPQQPDADGDAR